VVHQDDLTVGEYKDLMMDKIEDLPERRFNACGKLRRRRSRLPRLIIRKSTRNHFR
jgi:hypothetical protein